MMSGGDQEPGHYYVGIDVGTGSVRAALVDQRGILLAFAEQPIKKWEPQFNHHEQSSEDIWAACCHVTKRIVQGIDVHRIRGLGFDATCSLVVLDKQFHPLPVNHEGDSYRNIIMWLDHRAVSQVHRINKTKHGVLQYVGGVMSVEMQAPKLLWLKENLRETCWDKAGHFFDLPDFLSWKATGVTARSLTAPENQAGFVLLHSMRIWASRSCILHRTSATVICGLIFSACELMARPDLRALDTL